MDASFSNNSNKKQSRAIKQIKGPDANEVEDEKSDTETSIQSDSTGTDVSSITNFPTTRTNPCTKIQQNLILIS